MAKRSMGMRNLKRRLFDRQPRAAMEQAIAEETTHVTESPDPPQGATAQTCKSGTYRVAERQSASGEVTLVVYGWENVQPGTLSWVFPSFQAAIKAARALRNATQWAIMGGRDASGAVLAERSA